MNKGFLAACCAFFLFISLAHSGQAQVLRDHSQMRPCLTLDQLRSLSPESGHIYTMKELEEKGFPDGTLTIDAYHSLDRRMPLSLQRQLRKGELISLKLKHATVVNMNFDHLGGETPVCLPVGTPVICTPNVREENGCNEQEIKFCATCCNVSGGFYTDIIKVAVKTVTKVVTNTVVEQAPPHIIERTRVVHMTTEKLVSSPFLITRTAGIQSVESYQPLGSISVYQVAATTIKVSQTQGQGMNQGQGQTQGQGQNAPPNGTPPNNPVQPVPGGGGTTTTPTPGPTPTGPPVVCPVPVTPSPPNGTVTNNPTQPGLGGGTVTDIPRPAPTTGGGPVVVPVNLN